MIRFTKALVVAALVAVGAGSAHASVVVSTGTGWTLTAYSGSDGSVPTPGPLTPAYVAIDNGSFPFPNWAAPLAGSQWITPTSNPAQSFDTSGHDGFYTFTSQSIFLTAGTVLSGKYMSDNTVKEIFLASSDGVAALLSPGLPAGNFTTPTLYTFGPVSANGFYTLNFQVQNYNQGSGNPVGLDVGAVPEPATWAMMIIGFLGLGFVGYRKSSRAGNSAARMA